jgi:chemotaxis-related protein WspD
MSDAAPAGASFGPPHPAASGSRSCWNVIGVFGDGSCPELQTKAHCRHCATYVDAGRRLLERELPDDYRQWWTQLVAAEKQEVKAATLSVLVFRVADEWMALRADWFQEAVDPRPIRTVPRRSNATFRGLVNVKGELVPCVSAPGVLGLTPRAAASNPGTGDAGKGRRLLVVCDGPNRWAFEVDALPQLFRLRTSEVEPSPATVADQPGSLTAGVFRAFGHTVGLLDENRFMTAIRRSLAP